MKSNRLEARWRDFLVLLALKILIIMLPRSIYSSVAGLHAVAVEWHYTLLLQRSAKEHENMCTLLWVSLHVDLYARTTYMLISNEFFYLCVCLSLLKQPVQTEESRNKSAYTANHIINNYLQTQISNLMLNLELRGRTWGWGALWTWYSRVCHWA